MTDELEKANKEGQRRSKKHKEFSIGFTKFSNDWFRFLEGVLLLSVLHFVGVEGNNWVFECLFIVSSAILAASTVYRIDWLQLLRRMPFFKRRWVLLVCGGTFVLFAQLFLSRVIFVLATDLARRR
jgi:hypothetical protein